MSIELLRRQADDYLDTVPEAAGLGPVGGTDITDTAARIHLADPSTPAGELAAITGMTPSEISQLYAVIAGDDTIRALTQSPYYPRRLMTAFGRTAVQDWKADPEYASRLLDDQNGQTVAPRNLEVHATTGSCDYTCTMCLWSDKEEKTYRSLGLHDAGLIGSTDWETVFAQAKDMGSQRIIFSGGGEPLLNRGLFDLIASAHDIGLATQLYSNGYGLRKLTDEQWEILLQMEQVRLSMHSPDPETYNTIVKMPEHSQALPTVSDNITEMLSRRQAGGSDLQVGIGFVTQAINHRQLEAMTEYALEQGVDFLNLRQDEVEVTRDLSGHEQAVIARQLSAIRQRQLDGGFDGLAVDMSDDMTALANGIRQSVRRVGSCAVKFFRPAISPYGIVAPCDLRAEPRFSNPAFILGTVRRKSLPLVMADAAGKDVPADCEQCMPSGRTINAVIAKVIADRSLGIDYTEQPF